MSLGASHDSGLPHHGLSSAPVRIAAISLFVTACLLALKLTVGIISGSIAVLSDAIDSGSDLAAGTAALISVRIAAWPADEAHPYGHGKVEAISASVAATIIALGGGFIVFQAVRRLVGETPDIDVGLGLSAMVIAAVANAVVSFYMRREAHRSNSVALHAEATHLRTNVVQAAAIIFGLALVGITGNAVFDPIVALGLAAYMGWVALGLIRTAAEEIMDTALPGEDVAAIRDVLLAHQDDIAGFHRLRTRRSGHVRHVDMHLVVRGQKTFEEVHELSDHIESEIQERLPGAVIVIHLEPETARTRTTLEALAKGQTAAGRMEEPDARGIAERHRHEE